MNERGMSLPEVMICAFIFAILVTGLLRYYQLLHSGKQRKTAAICGCQHGTSSASDDAFYVGSRDITADDADTFIPPAEMGKLSGKCVTGLYFRYYRAGLSGRAPVNRRQMAMYVRTGQCLQFITPMIWIC